MLDTVGTDTSTILPLTRTAEEAVAISTWYCGKSAGANTMLPPHGATSLLNSISTVVVLPSPLARKRVTYGASATRRSTFCSPSVGRPNGSVTAPSATETTA